MKKYLPSEIEAKWQKKWVEDSLYRVDFSSAKPKKYILVEFAYPSGDLHMGHWFTFVAGDIYARFCRMLGCEVFLPNGFDAFGLPAENAAITRHIHPKDWTYDNIRRMKQQFETMGVSIDWDKTAVTADAGYYRWNQWIFLKMYEKGIAYRGKAMANWCPKDATVLADENIEDGKCWRCGTEVVKKEVEQWFLKLTAYADRLIWSDPSQADWPKPLRAAQNDWIGKSEGMEIEFRVKSKQSLRSNDLQESRVKVYTVFPETIFGVTYMVLAPEHKLISEIITKEQKSQVDDYIKASQKKSELERKIEEREKTGVFTGAYCINPVNGKKVPIWIADYVISSYGTGAVMGVPGSDHRDFDFAKKYDLEAIRVIGKTPDDQSPVESASDVLEFGWIVNSPQFNGLKTPNPAREKIKDWLTEKGFGQRKTQYHLHDWSISRQRYWGTPIPMIHCDKCGIVPVPEKDLPVELPYEVDYTPQGKPPLATAEEWVNVKCPKCSGPAKRDTETMDGFVDNSWYFYRYLDEYNEKEIFDKKIVKDWLPLEIYIGGAEHTVGHTLYSRFFTKFFHDLGLIDFDEYAKKRVHHGVILGPDGSRMSKSRGNVVNPDEEVKSYGADAIRLYLMFLGPFDIVAPWNPDGVNGAYHFLQRVWGLQDKVTQSVIPAEAGIHINIDSGSKAGMTNVDLRLMHKTIKKVTEDIEQLKFNTAIAALMEWLNHLSRKEKVAREEYKTFLSLLAPFAPHITEELWSLLVTRNSTQNETSSNEQRETSNEQRWSIHQQSWPVFDNKYLEEGEILIPVQINGKVRNILKLKSDILSNRSVVEKMAIEDEKIKKFLEGKSVKKIVYIPNKIISFVVGNN
ncbi:leucine--tRNA ligase [Candidatus Daviesbacteria bacterium]|nr:leucine--tRNA ligase [Candidatus Daviesbacteria bacterium]